MVRECFSTPWQRVASYEELNRLVARPMRRLRQSAQASRTDRPHDLAGFRGGAAAARTEYRAIRGLPRDAKPVNFGAIYGIGPTSLAANAFADYGIDMSESEAAHALDRFFSTYHTLRAWRQDNADLCQRRGYVEIGAGRAVEAHWEMSGRLSFPQCCNLPIQGICADAMLRAITMVHSRLRSVGIRGGLVASIHDEVHADDAEAACVLLQETMIEAFAITIPGAPTTGVASAAIGASWAAVKQ